MRTIIEFFKKKWVIQLLGVIAISVIIWFIGPLIAIAGMVPLESELVRLIFILVILILWILSLLWSQIRAKKADQAMMQDLSQSEATGATADQSAEELQILKERFDEALGGLSVHPGAPDWAPPPSAWVMLSAADDAPGSPTRVRGPRTFFSGRPEGLTGIGASGDRRRG